MLFLSSVLIIIRHLREVHFSIMIMFYGYIGTLECSILAFCFGVIDIPKCSVDLLIAAGNAVLTFAGEISLTFALQAELAGLVSLVRTVDVVRTYTYKCGKQNDIGFESLCIIFEGICVYMANVHRRLS